MIDESDLNLFGVFLIVGGLWAWRFPRSREWFSAKRWGRIVTPDSINASRTFGKRFTFAGVTVLVASYIVSKV